jgi:hypothetical protein
MRTSRLPHAGSEAAFVEWWHTGAITGHDLVAVEGQRVRVLYAGRRGGNAGPDVCDAVVLIDDERRCGDIELHLRPAGWYAHHHQIDPRYNRVILHVVAGGTLLPGREARLASGGIVPQVIVRDPSRFTAQDLPLWPCRAAPLAATEYAKWLAAWGRERFARNVERAKADLAALGSHGATLEALLRDGIATALGYGRDPVAMRAVLHGDAAALDRLSGRRIRAFMAISNEKESLGMRCCGALLAGGETDGWERLLRIFDPAGSAIGRQRAGIVLWNAVLPILAAYGAACDNLALEQTAHIVADAAPGLPSNAITRAMTHWLKLTAPRGALTQQGLHHLHASWCREKRCDTCPLNQSRQR